MKRSEMNGQTTKRRGQKMSGGWLLAVVCLLFASSCRAPAPDAGRYQWNIVPRGEGWDDQIYVIDTVTGEIAEWSRGSSWSPFYRAPLSTPDWDDIRKQRARQVEREKQEKEAREKGEALAKSYAQMPLEKQVAWAKDISVCKFMYRGSSAQPALRLSRMVHMCEGLKGRCFGYPASYKSTDDNLVVCFEGETDGVRFRYYLSRTPIDNKDVFPAPATIIDDVKAEVKRQAEQKESHAENH